MDQGVREKFSNRMAPTLIFCSSLVDACESALASTPSGVAALIRGRETGIDVEWAEMTIFGALRHRAEFSEIRSVIKFFMELCDKDHGSIWVRVENGPSKAMEAEAARLFLVRYRLGKDDNHPRHGGFDGTGDPFELFSSARNGEQRGDALDTLEHCYLDLGIHPPMRVSDTIRLQERPGQDGSSDLICVDSDGNEVGVFRSHKEKDGADIALDGAETSIEYVSWAHHWVSGRIVPTQCLFFYVPRAHDSAPALSVMPPALAS